MSKELEALQKIKQFKTDMLFIGTSEIKINKAIDKVEKALKAQEQYVQIAEKEHEDYMVLCGEITRLKNKHKKQEKVLEIIKEKRVNVDNFLNHIKKDTNYKEYKRLCSLYKIMVFSDKELTKEEYDLLKEVLYENNK